LIRAASLALPTALATGAALPAADWTVEEVIAEARTLCASFESGTVEVMPGAVHVVELTGDGRPDTLPDWNGLSCSTMASAWGGTGGSALSILIEGQRFDHMAFGWTVVDFDGSVLLLSQHGVNRNATGGDRCVQALVWTAGTLTGAGWPADEDESGAMPKCEGE
jgi:hypothetical protein